jgi:hypothetical protein
MSAERAVLVLTLLNLAVLIAEALYSVLGLFLGR